MLTSVFDLLYFLILITMGAIVLLHICASTYYVVQYTDFFDDQFQTTSL